MVRPSNMYTYVFCGRWNMSIIEIKGRNIAAVPAGNASSFITAQEFVFKFYKKFRVLFSID